MLTCLRGHHAGVAGRSDASGIEELESDVISTPRHNELHDQWRRSPGHHQNQEGCPRGASPSGLAMLEGGTQQRIHLREVGEGDPLSRRLWSANASPTIAVVPMSARFGCQHANRFQSHRGETKISVNLCARSLNSFQLTRPRRYRRSRGAGLSSPVSAIWIPARAWLGIAVNRAVGGSLRIRSPNATSPSRPSRGARIHPGRRTASEGREQRSW